MWLQNNGHFNDNDNRNLMELDEFKEQQRNLGNSDDQYKAGQAMKRFSVPSSIRAPSTP